MSDRKSGYEIFRGVPGPSPWYLSDDQVPLRGCTWVKADANDRAAAGNMLLCNESGVLAVFGFYNYVTALDDSTLLVWNQKRRIDRSSLTFPIEMFTIQTRMLSPLADDLKSSFEKLNASEEGFLLGGSVQEKITLLTTNVTDELVEEFPAGVRDREELLLLCHSSGIDTSSGAADLALIVANPKRSKYRLYPQDWFNNSDMDFGYQWVTRIVRNARTGRIEGEGFRIFPFVLDETLREIVGRPGAIRENLRIA